MLIVTFDEAEDDDSACCNEPRGFNTPAPGGESGGPGGGRVGAVLLGPYARAGAVVTEPLNHYGMLRSVEDLFGLGHLGYAGQDGLKTFQDIGALRTTATAPPSPPTRRRRARLPLGRRGTYTAQLSARRAGRAAETATLRARRL